MFGLSKRERAERGVREIQTWVVGQSLVQAASFDAQYQMAVAVEACAFFLHAVSRFSFRPHGEKLREYVFDTCTRQMVETFSDMVRKLSKKSDSASLEADMLSLFNTRELEYGSVGQLLSDKFNDRDSAVWLAAYRLGEAADVPERDIRVFAITTRLMESLIAMDLKRRIEQLEGDV
jgi:hypothetical protein